MSDDVEPTTRVLALDDEVIDAGEVISVPAENVVAFDHRKHRAETSRVLAILSVTVLAALIAVQYAAVITLGILGKDAVADRLTQIFQGLLPVVSGLAVSAYTYYFTRDK